ncbi:hypothetical protein [Flexibacter flexilis]|nr:hypothetical protein [Flexibacter flexilis]
MKKRYHAYGVLLDAKITFYKDDKPKGFELHKTASIEILAKINGGNIFEL